MNDSTRKKITKNGNMPEKYYLCMTHAQGGHECHINFKID